MPSSPTSGPAYWGSQAYKDYLIKNSPDARAAGNSLVIDPKTGGYSGSVQKPVFGGLGNVFHGIGEAMGHIPGLGGMDKAMAPGASISDILHPVLGGALLAGTLGFGGATAAGAGGAADLLGAQAADTAAGSEGGGVLNFLKNYVTGQPLSSGGGMGLKQMLKIGARVGIPAAAIYGLFGKKKGDPAAAGGAGGPSGQNVQDLLGYAALASAFMNPYEQQIRQAYQTQASAIKRLIPQLPSQFRGVAGLMQADMQSQSQMLPGLLGQQAAGLPLELLNAQQTNPLGSLPQGSTGTVNIPGMGQVKLPGTG